MAAVQRATLAGRVSRGEIVLELLRYAFLACRRALTRRGCADRRSPEQEADEASGLLPPEPLEPVDEASLLSVVIPAYNEGPSIVETVRSALRGAAHVEVVVCDGGSRDQTPTLAADAGARVVSGASGRAACLNRGAAEARGTLLLFVHADTTLPSGCVHHVVVACST